MVIEMRGGFVGLDAAVYCNCWRDGKTTEPPVPRECVHLDEDGWVWNSNPDWTPGAQPGTEEWVRGMATDIAFDSWKQSQACPHDNMQLVSARIANWSGVGGLLQALQEGGEDQFATVLTELPTSNDGSTSPELAARMLNELNVFLELEAQGQLSIPAYGFGDREARSFTIEALQTVCRVSVASGNPIAWN